MPPSIPKITLHPATPSDVPTLSQISSKAFESDTHTRLKALAKGYDNADDMSGVLSSWISRGNGKCVVMKAVADDGEIVGFACWAFVGVVYDGKEEGEVEPKADEKKEEEKDAQKTEEEEKPKSKIEELGALTNASMQEWSARLTPPGSKCMILIAIPVLPSFQSRGVGSSLIQWGTKIADEKGVYCWVSSSDKGWTAFQKNGFAEVGRLEVDLDEYAEGVRNAESDDGKWGMYVFRYMKRDAVARVEQKGS